MLPAWSCRDSWLCLHCACVSFMFQLWVPLALCGLQAVWRRDTLLQGSDLSLGHTSRIASSRLKSLCRVLLWWDPDLTAMSDDWHSESQVAFLKSISRLMRGIPLPGLCCHSLARRSWVGSDWALGSWWAFDKGRLNLVVQGEGGNVTWLITAWGKTLLWCMQIDSRSW